MRLKQSVLDILNSSENRNRLAVVLKCTEFTIIRYIDSNSDNLTKLAALKEIKKITKLKESEIIDKESVSEAHKLTA